MRFSHSRLQTYEHCPRKYKFAYVDKLRTGQKSIEAFLGTCVHEVLETLHKRVSAGASPDLDALLRLYEETWERDWDDGIFVAREDLEPAHYREVGRRCIRAYFEAESPFDKDRTVALEYKVSFPLYVDGGQVELVGFIDRLAILPDGTFRIHDYKTSAKLPTQAEADADRQLALYEVGVRRSWPDAKGVELVWHYLRFGKSLVSRRSPEALDALLKETARGVSKALADEDYEPRPGTLCDWCEFKPICPAWRHAAEIEKKEPEQREADEGWRLVDEFRALEERRRALHREERELKEREEAVKARAVELARREQLTALEGRRGRLEIHLKRALKVPTKTHHPQDHQKLEEWLRRGSLWHQVSTLDARALVEAYENGSLPLEVQEKLGHYLKRVETPTVRFKPRKGEDAEK